MKTEGSSTNYGLNLATVITQPRVDKKWLSIDLKIDGEEKEVPIRHFMSFDDMPQEYHYLGMRTFVDVFFHSDYNEGSSQVSYQFDLESSQVFNELKSSTNYINMLPKTQTLTVLPNNTEKVKYAFSNDTILREVENSADMFFIHSFVRGLKQQVYFIPYIEYNKTDFGTKEVSPFYYIPKDIDISSYDINVALSKAEEKEIDQKWLRNIDVSYYDAVQFLAKNGDEVVAYIETQPTIDLESIIIPERNLHDENIPRMVDALTPNYAFNDAKNVKELLIGIFSQNNWLNKTITKMDSFYDDNNNPDKCYIPQLVSFLRSLNEKTDEFQNDFGNVNEVNELTRIISLQHTDLVGHENLVPMDISYDGEVKGTNVSDELRIDDVIYVNESGFIVKVKRKVYEDDGKNWEYREYQMNPTNLIIWDCYTKTSKLASFFDVPHTLITDEEDLQPFCLKDYTDKWGWGLSLPERFFKTPILGNIRTNIITGYYRFFLLNPAVGKTRVGNYVQDNILNVSPKLLSPLSWDKDWDCCYEYILKTLHEKGLTITKEEQEDAPDEEALSFTIYDDYFIAFNFIEDVSIKTKRVRVDVSSTPEDTLVMFPHILSEITLSKYDNMSLLKKQFGGNKIYFLELGEETKVICDNTSYTYNVSEPENPLSETYPLTSIKVYQGAKNGEEVFYSKHKMRVSGSDKEFFIYKEHDTLEDAISTIDFKTALESTTGIEEETIDLSNPEKEETQNKSFVPTLFSISNAKTISSEEFIWRT